MKKFLLLFSTATIVSLSATSSVIASMAQPMYGIKEQTKECTMFYMGDECGTCEIPEGWEAIDEFGCPEGYDEIQAMSDCTPLKTPFCCTVSHSGADGDCEDVVVSDVEHKCAFVEDIKRCEKLPADWKMAQEVDSWGHLCPSLEYEWLEETLDCQGKASRDDYPNNPLHRDRENLPGFEYKGVPTLLLVAGGIIGILLLLVWAIFRRNQK